ncbi:Branched-chain amino acid transport system 2 carrier protein [Terrisporobacter petrolearius]
MGTIAALNFGIVIALAIKSKGVKDEKAVVSLSIKSGLIAGALLVVIYSLLAHLGANSGFRFGATENGAQTLTNVFGKPGALLLAVTFTFACLTTSVGLITSCSQYFTTLTNKLSYKSFVRILTLSSMTLANLGLTKILAVSVPVLNAIYPISIMLIVLAIIDSFLKESSFVYKFTILFTGVVSVVDALGQVGVNLGYVASLFSKLPLYSQGLGWIIPAILGMFLGLVVTYVKSSLNNRYVLKTENLE